MPGRALLLTDDRYLEEIVRRIGREVVMRVDGYGSIETAAQACALTTFDLVVVDCDDVHNGSTFLRHLRRAWTTRHAAVIAVLNGGTSPHDALDLGADATVEKFKASTELQRQVLSICRALNAREDLRVAVSCPVWVTMGRIVDRRAEVFNVSEGGLGLRFAEPIVEDEILTLRFELPGCEHRFHLRGEIVWADGAGRVGVGFLDVAEPARGKLAAWLAQRRSLKSSSAATRL